MKLSVVIPYYESDSGKPEILKRCTDSMTGYDELIVIWNDKMGYAKSINKGLALAKGDFILMSTDDVIWDGMSLKRMCNPEAVTSPVVNGNIQNFWGVAFCMPRWVYEKVGGLWEGYRVSYFDDDDYQCTLEKAGVPLISVPVNLSHPEGGRTLHTFADHDQFYQENMVKFRERWG